MRGDSDVFFFFFFFFFFSISLNPFSEEGGMQKSNQEVINDEPLATKVAEDLPSVYSPIKHKPKSLVYRVKRFI